MKTVTELYTTEVSCRCPECGNYEEGFVTDPRGQTFKCESCGAAYQVHPNADVEYGIVI